MSDAVFDRGFYFPSPVTDWYRERPFKVAFVASLLIHAALIALVPGFRAVVIEPPTVLNVEIILPEQPQVRTVPLREAVPPAPVTTPAPPQRTVQEPVVRPEPKIEPRPEPVLRQPEPGLPPIPRAEIVPPPRPEPRPEPLVVPKPELRPEPPPVARVEPRQEPRPLPNVEPIPEPRTEVPPEPQPVPRVEPPPVQVGPRIEPVTPPVQATAPPVTAATVRAPPVIAPVPPPPVTVAAPVQTPSAPGNSEAVATEQLRRMQENFSADASKKLRDTLNNAVYPSVTRQRTEWNLVLHVRVSAEGVVEVTVSEGSGERAIDNVVIRNLRSAPKNLRELLPFDLRGHAFITTVPVRIQIRKS